MLDAIAKEAYTKDHMNLVDRATGVMIRRFGFAVEGDEIRSFALMGFAQALDRFDEEQGIPFEKYANARIKGAIYDGLVEVSWFSRSLIRKISFYRQADEMMKQSSEENPPSADLVETTHRLARELKELATAYVTTHAFDPEPVQDLSDEKPEDAESLLEEKQYYERIHQCMEDLSKKQRAVIQLYFLEEKTLEEVAKQLGYKKSWVSKLLASGLAKMRKNMEKPPDG